MICHGSWVNLSVEGFRQKVAQFPVAILRMTSLPSPAFIAVIESMPNSKMTDNAFVIPNETFPHLQFTIRRKVGCFLFCFRYPFHNVEFPALPCYDKKSVRLPPTCSGTCGSSNPHFYCVFTTIDGSNMSPNALICHFYTSVSRRITA